MTRQSKNFKDVVNVMKIYGFELYNKKKDINNKTCLYFKGINPSISMQYVVGNKFNVYRLCNKYDYVHIYEIKRV